MKRQLSVAIACAVFAGTLVSFAGCAQIKDDARVVELFEAVAEAEISQFEFRSETEMTYSQIDDESSTERKSKVKIEANGYEEDEKPYADSFTDTYSYSERKAHGKTTTETEETYTVSFVRGDITYSSKDGWDRYNAKKGNFDSLLKQMKKENAELSTSTTSSGGISPDELNIPSMGALAPVVGAQAYKRGGGYRVEIDFVHCQETVLKGYESALVEYEKNPNMTLEEFFGTEYIERYLSAVLADATTEDAADVLIEALRDAGIYISGLELPEAGEGVRGKEYFYSCLDSEELYSLVRYRSENLEWKEGGTLGSAKMSSLYGPADELLEDVRKDLESPEKALLEEMMGFANGENDSGKFKYVVTVDMDKELNVTGAKVEMEYSMEEKQEPEDEDEDGEGRTTKQSGKFTVELTVPEKAPKLTDLKGLKADMGYRFVEGVYEIPSCDTQYLFTTSYDMIYGTYWGKVTVGKNKMTVEVTFEDRDKTFTVTEKRDYDLNENIYDSEYLFDSWELPNGKRVGTYDGIRYSLSVYPKSGGFYFSLGGQEYGFLDIPSEQYYEEL